MSEVVVVAIISLVGTLLGSLAGVLTANRLSNYRIEQLEKKVDAHNKIIERTFKLEGAMTEVQHDIRDLKARVP